MPRSRIFTVRRAALASLVLAGLLLTPGLAAAGKGRGEAKLDRLCEQVSCSEQQRDEIALVFKQMRQDIKPDREALRELRRQLADEWQQPKPDERKLAKLADKIAAHERNVADRRLEAMLELHALLSPEQREQAAKLLFHGHDRKAKRRAQD